MDNVKVIDEPVSQRAIDLRNEVTGYTERVFKMYCGQPMDIVLEFSDNLIGVVYDKFGENTKMFRANEQNCIATVKVQISPAFWGWIFQFGKLMLITAPDDVIGEYKYKAGLIAGGINGYCD